MTRMSPNISERGIEDFVENLLLWSGLVFVLLGFFGLLMMLFFPKIYGDDQVLQFGVSFVDAYMMVMGLFLVAFHKKIFVRGFRT